jgi:hypothetical protein
MAPTSRRHFLQASARVLASGIAGVFILPGGAFGAAVGRPSTLVDHPTPRPGITGAKVLGAADLPDAPGLVPLFDAVRAAAPVIDGIRCHCGCAGEARMYSLLSCYEGDGMARVCPICQGEARLATRMHREGRSLKEIRIAVDAQFG